MKSKKVQIVAVAAANAEAKKAVAAATRTTAQDRKKERELAKDIWQQTTKVVVPAWFGQCAVEEGFKLGKTFAAPGLLALVCIGKAAREKSALNIVSACEVSMQIDLRPSGFDRGESRDLARAGFF